MPLKTGAELQEGSEPVSGVCSVCWGSGRPGPPKQHSPRARVPNALLFALLCFALLSLSLFSFYIA